MDPLPLAERVAAIEGRRAGSDAERRAALVLADAVRGASRKRRRSTHVEPLWVRPHRGALHALLAALAVAGSVVSVDHALAGLALAGAAVLLLAADLSGRVTLLRRLTYERATQDVVSRDDREARVRLVVTAATDAASPGLAGRGAPARLEARLRRRLRGHLPGPYGVLVAALLALVGCTLARVLGAEGTVVGAIQLVPTVVALLGVGAGLDQAVASPSPQAAGEASAAAVAVALVAALDAEPPAELAVDLVLAGAGAAHALGIRRWLRDERRRGRRGEEVAVLHVAPCGAGRPAVWTRDGLVLPLRFHPRMIELATAAGLPAHESRGTSGARAARALRWPAVAIGCVDRDGAVPRLAAEDDTAERLDPEALDRTLEGCLALVRALDADLAGAPAPAPPRARRPRPATPARAERPTRRSRGALPAAATLPVEQPPPDAWRERPPTAPPPQAPPPPPTSARAARRAAAEREAAERAAAGTSAEDRAAPSLPPG